MNYIFLTIKKIDISLNKITSISLKFISTSYSFSNLNYLNLGYNRIEDEGVEYLISSICLMSSLKELWLEHNKIEIRGLGLLIKYYCNYHCSNLNFDRRYLNILGNPFGDEGIEVIYNFLNICERDINYKFLEICFKEYSFMSR